MGIKAKYFIAGTWCGIMIAVAIWGINNIIHYYSKSDQDHLAFQLTVSDEFDKESSKEAYIEHFKSFSTSGSQCVGLGPESELLLKTPCKQMNSTISLFIKEALNIINIDQQLINVKTWIDSSELSNSESIIIYGSRILGKMIEVEFVDNKGNHIKFEYKFIKF